MTQNPNESRDGPPEPEDRAEPDGHTISPLPGELGVPNVAAGPQTSTSKKGLLAVALLVGSLIAVLAVTVQRFSAGVQPSAQAESKLVRDRPTAATSEPRRLEMPPAPTASRSPATAWARWQRWRPSRRRRPGSAPWRCWASRRRCRFIPIWWRPPAPAVRPPPS